MEIPSLPTDNLYKFITVLGLAAAAFCFVMAHQKSLEAEALTADSLIKQIDLHQDFARAVARVGPDNQKLLDELGDRQKQSDMMMDILKKIVVQRADTFPSMQWYIMAGKVSAAIAVLGALLWYFRFQRHMDRMVARGRMPNS